MSDRLGTAPQHKQRFMALVWSFIHRFIMFARRAQNKPACIPVVHVRALPVFFSLKIYSIVDVTREVGVACFSHWFTDLQLQEPSCKSASDGKRLPPNPTLFQWGGRDSPFCKLTPSGDCGPQYPRPPPCTPLSGDTRKATKPILRRRDVDLRRRGKCDRTRPIPIWAGSHWRSLEIYEEDDTADYSQLLRRIGRGL